MFRMQYTILEIAATVTSAFLTYVTMRQYRAKSRVRRVREVTTRLLEG